MANNRTAALALLIGLPLALHGQPIHMEKVPSNVTKNLATAEFQHVFPLSNLVSSGVLSNQGYELIRPVQSDGGEKVALADAQILQTLGELSRKTRF